MSDGMSVFKMNKARTLYVALVMFVGLLGLSFHSMPAKAACGFNSIGDYTCGEGQSNPYGETTSNVGQDVYNMVLPQLLEFPDLSCSAALSAVLIAMPPAIADAVTPQVIEFIDAMDEGGDLCDLVDRLQELLTTVLAIDTLCGAISGLAADAAAMVSGSFQAQVYNLIGTDIAFSDDIMSVNVASLIGEVCLSPIDDADQDVQVTATPTGDFCDAHSNGDTPPLGSAEALPDGGNCNERIANSAVNAVGASTADIPGTEGGALGCAAAVTRIIDCAGAADPGNISVQNGTAVLYDEMEDSPCFEKVCDSVTGCDLMPGDVLVTARNGSTGRAGHTGIYVGPEAGVENEIVSNSSSGFQGSAPGTVQPNYSVEAWASGVESRNPSRSGVYRCTCGGSSTPPSGSCDPVNEATIKSDIRAIIEGSEGRELCQYRDTEGHCTIGVGHLVCYSPCACDTSVCMTDAEVDALLDQDIEIYYTAARSQMSAANVNSHDFLIALFEVNYQLGTGWRSKMGPMWDYVRTGQYIEAANYAEGTLWNTQTPTRVDNWQDALRALDACQNN